VIFLEHRWLHYATGAVPAGFVTTPLTAPEVVRTGRDVTIVASSYMVLEALRAATALADIGCEAEVIDLCVLRPLNVAPIAQSLHRTGRLITCDVGWRTLGPGAEVVAQLVERHFNEFRRPPVRLGLPDLPTPSSAALAAAYYPGSQTIIDAVQELCELDPQATATARASVEKSRAGVPIDKPDPAFRGPF
jgi:pyruvate/2-oxoglutarate/acetoin dehydrogenase E1 component